MKIRITTNQQSLIATLNDSATARDFFSLLPLTLTLQDYASTKKISNLPRKLTTNVPRASAWCREYTLARPVKDHAPERQCRHLDTMRFETILIARLPDSHVPDAEVVHDRFCLTTRLNEAVDQVGRTGHKLLMQKQGEMLNLSCELMIRARVRLQWRRSGRTACINIGNRCQRGSDFQCV